MSDAVVNKTRTEHPQRGIGDNGGPALQKLTAKRKVERIQEVLDMDISGTSKLIGIRIIADADTDGITPELSTEDLKRSASVRDRETVYRATRKLDERKVARTVKEEGRPNRYVVLPSEAIDEALDDIDRTSRVSSDHPRPIKPDGLEEGLPVGLSQTTPIRSNPTGPVEPVGSNPTGRVQPDAPAPTPSRTRVEDNNIINTNPSTDREEVKERGFGGKPSENLEPEAQEDERPEFAPPPSALEAFNLYNEMALRVGLPQARTLTPQRRKSIMARMREHGGIEAWKTALANIEKSAFLQGGNDRSWRADLEFLCQAKSFTKVVEGTYGNGAHAGGNGAATVSSRSKLGDPRELAEALRQIEEEAQRKSTRGVRPYVD